MESPMGKRGEPEEASRFAGSRVRAKTDRTLAFSIPNEHLPDPSWRNQCGTLSRRTKNLSEEYMNQSISRFSRHQEWI